MSKPASSRSELTSSSSGTFCSASVMRGTQVSSSSKVSAWMVYWYCALPCRPPMRRSCTGCRNSRAPATLESLLRRRAISDGGIALRQRLQIDEDEAAIGLSAAAGKADHAFHRWVLANCVHELRELPLHRLKRDALV